MNMILKTLGIASLMAFSVTAMAEVSLTTGAGYQNMVKELNANYEKVSGKKNVENFGGNIGQMLSQVSAGSGINLVITDKGTLKNLKSPVEFSTTQSLGTTPLVFIWGKKVQATGPQDLTTDKIKSFAMPDPKAAVYGRAAKAYIEQNNLSEKLKDKTHQIASVPQVVAYVAKGEVDAGFVNRTAAKNAKDKIGGSVEITEGYPKIEMIATVVKGNENDADIQNFLKYLASPEAKQILKKHGID